MALCGETKSKKKNRPKRRWFWCLVLVVAGLARLEGLVLFGYAGKTKKPCGCCAGGYMVGGFVW